MEKFIKSIFSSSEKKTSKLSEEDDKNEFTPPLDERRKLSISRSGKMKQANKKRNILSTDIYGQEDFQTVERPKSLEYRVNNQFKIPGQETRNWADNKKDQVLDDSENNYNRKELTPEEEIESAFKIIDKAL